jgi:CreA protein
MTPRSLRFSLLAPLVFQLAGALAGLCIGLFASSAVAEPIAEVDTAFKLVGPDHKVLVEVFDDPKVVGVSCYLSRAKTGGIKGASGLAQDSAQASVACIQIGDIRFTAPLQRQEEVFSERTSLIFKHVRVVRLVDAQRNALIYLVYSERLIEGSQSNSLTTVSVPRNQAIPLR